MRSKTSPTLPASKQTSPSRIHVPSGSRRPPSSPHLLAVGQRAAQLRPLHSVGAQVLHLPLLCQVQPALSAHPRAHLCRQHHRSHAPECHRRHRCPLCGPPRARARPFASPRRYGVAVVSLEDFRPARATLPMLQALGAHRELRQGDEHAPSARDGSPLPQLYHHFSPRRNAVFNASTQGHTHFDDSEESWRSWAEERKKRETHRPVRVHARRTACHHLPTHSLVVRHSRSNCSCPAATKNGARPHPTRGTGIANVLDISRRPVHPPPEGVPQPCKDRRKNWTPSRDLCSCTAS
ncbi:hypothetical protein L1887_54392 [Cichorium endivia]|nr:hypothetical protein L1887_54392 [Cichorium endivia]